MNGNPVGVRSLEWYTIVKSLRLFCDGEPMFTGMYML